MLKHRNINLKKYTYMILLCLSALIVLPVYGYKDLHKDESSESSKPNLDDVTTPIYADNEEQEEVADTDKVLPEDMDTEQSSEGDGQVIVGNAGEDMPENNVSTPGEETKRPIVEEPEKIIPSMTPDELCEADKIPGPTERTLMIGDSRTVGIKEYSQLENVVFFADTGASVYNIWDKELEVPSIGYTTLEAVLQNGEYGNVCVMLGINELGYNISSIVSEYQDIVEAIKVYQPNAKIFLGANLHVTERRSQSDDIFNNDRINQLNGEFEKLADNQRIFYLDVNELFDDANGNLDQNYSTDDTHIYGKYYIAWGQWIVQRLL